MEPLAINQTLLSAWGYTYDCREGLEEEAQAAFLRTLNREPVAPTDAMQKGLEFERYVYARVAGAYELSPPAWERGIRAVATRLTGTQTQVYARRRIKVDGITFQLSGIMDAIRAGVIYDVKFSTHSFGSADLAGKYLNSPQHPAYFYLLPEANSFEYLVSDGSDLYREVYDRDDARYIGDIISEFIVSLKEQQLWDTYERHWKVR